MRGRVLLCACVVLLLLPLATAQSGSGGGGGSNPDDDQFKTDLTTFFTKLGNIQPIDTTGGTTTPPTTAPAGKDKGHSHLHSKSDAAISNIPGLTSDDIKHMKNSLQQAPDWQTSRTRWLTLPAGSSKRWTASGGHARHGSCSPRCIWRMLLPTFQTIAR